MSSRRTRSGASLGSSEPCRLRRTPVRKQLEAKSAEESSVEISSRHDLSKTSLELSSGEPVSEHAAKSKQYSLKKVQLSCSNIWERLAKNDGVLLGSSVAKGSTIETHDTANGKSRTVLKERVILSNSSSIQKCRKPEILVSLLEGEPSYPNSHRKDTANFNSGHAKEQDLDNSNKASEKSVIPIEAVSNCGSEENSDTYHVSPSSVCYFHNYDSHRNDSLNDFSDMPDVPGEPFFVSLSKDENKELNMVKTSSGTVRVGCSLRKLADYNHPYTDQGSNSSLFSATERSRNMRQEPSSEHKTGKRSGCCLNSSDIRSHKGRLDESKDHGWNHQGKNSSDSELKPAEHKNNILEMFTSKHLEMHEENSKSGSSKGTWNSDVHRVENTKSDNLHPSEIAQNKKRISEITLQSESGFKTSGINIPSHFKHLTPCRPSQYPLMKEILIEQNYLPLASATPGPKCVVPQGVASEASDKRYLTSAETLKSFSGSLASLPSVLSADLDSESKHVVKRSERIRCKSVMVKPCSVTLHQSVISTMKPADKTFKTKSKSSHSKKGTKVNFGRESQQKKSKKVYEGIKRTMVIKGQSDFQKNKVTMSQEVMESIIQSIEETVSGCHGEEKPDSSLDPASKDSSVSSFTTAYTSCQNTGPRITSTPRDLVMVDHWSDSTLDHDYNISSNSEYSLTQASRPASKNGVMNSGGNKTQKLFNSKKTARKTKKTDNAGNKSKTLKVRSSRSKLKSLTITTTIEDRPSSITSTYSSAETATNEEADPPGAGTATIAVTAGKRFRKRTRKAKEAFGDDDVFCDEYWTMKKSKSRNSGSTSSDSSSSSGQQRPRRSSQTDGHIIDPVLEEHAFILWASENRSQLELQNPRTPSSEVDTILLLRWCEVTESVKAKFFLRAREAFSDDDRTFFRPSSVTDLEASMFGDLFSDSDPVFTEFIRLPIDKQRDMLRKWLKFFQQTLAKKEYIDFIVTFKRACNRDLSSPSRRSKRTRMRCLDPSHYKMLFDMIRLTKPKVLEMYKAKLDQDKSAGSDAYSIILLKLVRNEPMPLVEPGCRSQVLTEMLQDLGIPDNMEMSLSVDLGTSQTSLSSSDLSGRVGIYGSDDNRNSAETTLPVVEWRTSLDADSKVTGEMKTDSGWSDCNFDESDYRLLDSDLALSLLSGLSETNELPLLDQDMLDQVFLAPPRMSAAFNPQRRAVNLYGRRIETLPQNLIPLVNRPSTCSPLCLPRLLPTDSVSYPKINIHYSSTAVPTSSGIMHHLQLRHASGLPHKSPRRDTRSASPVRGGWCRRSSPIDMHTNNTSMENMLQNQAHFNGPHSKCFKVHTKVMSPQIKLNLQPLQLPINCHSHQQNKLHPRVIPFSCGLQQRFPTVIYSPTSPAVLDKLGSHHISQMGAQSLASSSSMSSRISHQPIGLGTQSPLITSLSPLRSVKYSHSGKSYNPHCQMVPYRPRMQLTAGSSSGHRRTTHTIPISTTHKASNTRTHASLQQIKVCLSTQTLKIPIAKLRESRKASHMKGKLNNFNTQSNSLECYSNLPCTQACQFNVRANPSTSVLAKVLNFQAASEMDHFSKISVADGLSNNTVSNSRPVNSTFIGTMRPITMQPVSTGLRSTTQLHLVSVVSSPISSSLKTTGSTQSAMVVSPLTVNRNSHVTTPSCIPISAQSKSDLSSFTAVSVADTHAVTTQNIHVIGTNSFAPTKNVNHWETRVCTGRNIISGSTFRDSYFQDFAEITETCGEFRVVGTCAVSTTDSMRKNTSDDSNDVMDTLVQTAESSVYSISCSDITETSVKSTDILINKMNSQDLNRLDNKRLVSDTKGIHPYGHGGKQDLALTSTASVISCNSQHDLEHVINSESDKIGQLLVMPQISPVSFCADSRLDGDSLTHDCESQIKDCQPSYISRDLLSSSTSCCQTSSKKCLSQTFATDTTSFVTTDIPWECTSETCPSSTDKSSNAKDECGSLMYADCENKVSGHESEHMPTLHASVENCDFGGDHDSKIMSSPTTECAAISMDGVKCNNCLLPDVCSPCISTENITTTSGHICYSHNSGMAQNTDAHPVETDDDMSEAVLERNTGVNSLKKLNRSSEFCEQEYSIGKFDSLWNMTKCIGTVPPSHSQTCTIGASSLHVLVDTSTKARSLLSSRRFVVPANQTQQASDDLRLSRKHIYREPVDPEPGPSVKKMAMCAVTVQSDNGCILVENLASREKNGSQPQRANLDLPVSSGNSCRAATSPVGATNKGGQLAYDHVSFTSTAAQLQNVQLTSRSSVVSCNFAHNNSAVTMNKSLHRSSTVMHSPNKGRKRIHYIQKHLPT